ncbi:aminopeptidase P N-terminal domain-containing protein [Candidatus Saccharibacteria bacterium]|nr:aminopeptidase P N-terminal domain-containing protein [Candidatus Saccharibacteria bacterium]
MSDILTADFFVANRKRLRLLFQGTAPIVLTASAQLQKGIDEVFFRQDRNFFYVTGINDPDIILVIDKDHEYLILPEQSDYQRDFHGQSNVELYARLSGIQTVLDHKAGWKKLGSRLRKVKHVATLTVPARFIDSYGFYTNPSRGVLVYKVKEYNNLVELLDLRQHFAVMRMIKRPIELEAINHAIKITSTILKKIKRKIAKYDYEYQVEADLTHGFRWSGGGHAFDPIVASGGNASIIHYSSNNDAIDKDGLLLLDVGAEFYSYAADISRTYSVNGRPTKRQEQVHGAVVEVQNYAYSLMKPGAVIKENERLIEQFMGEKLRSLGLIKNIESDEVRRYYPHATSHHLGMDVHDLGDYQRPQEPGMVLTVEPGIYIHDESIGVRIEDDIVITPTGYKVLTSSLSIDL